MMLSSFLSLALVTATFAAPTPESALAAPPKHKEFTVAFSIFRGNESVYLSTHAVANKTKGAPNNGLVLLGKGQGPGTPAYFNGNHTNAALTFDLTGCSDPKARGAYGAIVPEVGDAYGVAEDVYGFLNQQDFKWGYSNGTIGHQLQAALNSFYACNDTVNGKPATVLKWGTPNNVGSSLVPPTGCSVTNIIQRFNIPGGAKSS